VLLKLFADRQLIVSEDVVAFLLHHMERSFAAARRLVGALDQAGLAEKRRITVKLARAVLALEAGEAASPATD
jgi:chromosomal replication initiation ATPase DnaA